MSGPQRHCTFLSLSVWPHVLPLSHTGLSALPETSKLMSHLGLYICCILCPKNSVPKSARWLSPSQHSRVSFNITSSEGASLTPLSISFSPPPSAPSLCFDFFTALALGLNQVDLWAEFVPLASWIWVWILGPTCRRNWALRLPKTYLVSTAENFCLLTYQTPTARTKRQRSPEVHAEGRF